MREYNVKVGEDKEYKTIGAALEFMHTQELSKDNFGCVEVDAGNYKEWLNQAKGIFKYNGTGPNLPAHCDLIGKGDVIISYGSSEVGEINGGVLRCNGDNLIKNISINNNGPPGQTGVMNGIVTEHDSSPDFVQEPVIIENCNIPVGHVGIISYHPLTVKNCNIKSYFGSCIQGRNHLIVENCKLTPRMYSRNPESPTGISFSSSGYAKNVTINSVASDNSTYDYAEGLYGFYIRTKTGIINITDCDINLDLTTEEDNVHWARLYGVYSVFGEKGKKVNIDNLKINLKATEKSKAIKVCGIGAHDEGKYYIKNSNILTSRIGDDPEGYCYDLLNEKGEMHVKNTNYDQEKTSGEILIINKLPLIVAFAPLALIPLFKKSLNKRITL